MKCKVCDQNADASVAASLTIQTHYPGGAHRKRIWICAPCRERILQDCENLAEYTLGLALDTFKDTVAGD